MTGVEGGIKNIRFEGQHSKRLRRANRKIEDGKRGRRKKGDRKGDVLDDSVSEDLIFFKEVNEVPNYL